MNKRLYHGTAYYPELWSEVIDEDIRYMREVGINVVRMGEFAWAVIEPEEGKINLTFFVDVIRKLKASDIDTIFCTPTAAPPIWLTECYPEIRYVDRDGVCHIHGSRQHVCCNSPVFRKFSRKITEAIAMAVGNLEGVIGWQIDNEFLCHNPACFCSYCKEKFHAYLREKYRSIENLNKAWGTDIWSEKYKSFEQIPQPFKSPFLHNCSLETSYKRFRSDSIVSFQKEQIDIIRQYSNAPITHNTMPPFHPLDNEDLFEDLDLASVDVYLPQDKFWEFIREFDWMRPRKQKPFWVMETSPFTNGSVRAGHKPLPDGFLKIEGIATYAFGGSGFSYWPWRQQRSGCEMVHSSIISSWGKPTIAFQNVVELSKWKEKVEPFFMKTKPKKAEVAVVYSTNSQFVLGTEPMVNGFDYKTKFYSDIYKVILEKGIYRDCIFERADVSGYKVVITPYMPVIRDEYLQKMKTFVSNGGIWIVGPMSGYRTKHHTAHTTACLGKLEEFASVETLYQFPLDKMDVAGTFDGISVKLNDWAFAFRAKYSYALGVYDNGPAAGEAFVTERSVDKGKVVLLGASMGQKDGKNLFGYLLEKCVTEAAVIEKSDVSWGTVIALRECVEYDLWVILNWDGNGGIVTLPRPGIELISKQNVAGRIEIESFDIKLIQFGKSNGKQSHYTKDKY